MKSRHILGRVEADLAALKKASKTLDRLLEAHGVDVEAVVADLKAARRVAAPSILGPRKGPL